MIVRFALALALLAAGAAAQEQASDVERLRAEVEELRRENQGLRRDLDRAIEAIDGLSGSEARESEAREAEIRAAVDRYLDARGEGDGGFDAALTNLLPDGDEPGPFEFHGRLTGRYSWFDSPSNVDGTNPNSFDQSDVALWFGWEPADWIRGVAEIEYVQGGDDFEIDQANLTLDLVEPEALALTAGKFYYPFGIERRSYSSTTNKLVDRPSPFRRIVPGTYSDVGLLASGEHRFAEFGPTASYELAVTNGLTGPGPEDRPGLDDNDSKQVGGRGAFSPLDGLEVGASGLWGRYDPGDELGLWLAGLDFRFTYDGIRFFDSTTGEVLDLRAEFLYGEVETREVGPGSGTSWFARHGAYAQLAYKTIYELPALEYLEYVVRWDVLEENDAVRDFHDAWRLAAGIGWSFHENVRFKLEYVKSFELRGPEIDNDGVMAEISANW